MNSRSTINSFSDWDGLSRQLADLRLTDLDTLNRELARLAPQLTFRPVLVRGGWYRLGGVVDAAGRQVAADIEKWAEAELVTQHDDMATLCEHYAESGFKATRYRGRSHYLVAASGPGAADFVQIEIEELQEILGHSLFQRNRPPSGIEDLIDPRLSPTAMVPIGSPRLALRRFTLIASFLERMRDQKPEAQPIHRFIEDWAASSAGSAGEFCQHWVLALREHLDSYRQTILHATPVALQGDTEPRFAATFGMQGLALRDALTGFDKAVGYPMAWFFHMLTTRSAPSALASAVIDDLQAGFHYLPDRDAAVIKKWLYRPYGF